MLYRGIYSGDLPALTIAYGEVCYLAVGFISCVPSIIITVQPWDPLYTPHVRYPILPS